MTKNVGGLDKTLRLIVGIIIIVLGFVNDSVWGAIGLIPILTAFLGWCPLYPILKIDTRCENDKCEK